MDYLVNEMDDQSFEHIGRLVVAKLKETEPTERRIAVNRMFDAIYAPISPIDCRLERLIEYVREAYDDLGDNDDARKSFTLKIRMACMQNGSNDENIANVANQINDVETPSLETWFNRKQKLGKKVRILIGSYIGTVARVDGIGSGTVSVQLANGKIVKYFHKHIEFVE